MKLYDTLEKRELSFKPINDHKVKMYACGPTVYFYAHIGNMRTYISIDLLKRTLIQKGYEVEHIMNITDVGHNIGDGDLGEDKIRDEAKKEHKTSEEIIQFYMKAFEDDTKKLSILKPTVVSRASFNIDVMIELINTLNKKGYLYNTKSGIYFDTSKFKDYGKLSGSTFEKLNMELIPGARVERPEGLKNITDFAVWRFSKSEEKEMVWNTSFGKGFPGWHIECSAMSMKFLGEQIDIHCGGTDHIPIHHTNEIAQSEAATEKKFVRYWFHVAFLIVDGKKMSKSLRNVYTVSDLQKRGFSALSFRYLAITVHYRNMLNFTFDSLKKAEDSLKAIYVFISKTSAVEKDGVVEKTFIKNIEEKKEEFFKEIYDDLNTPKALAKLHEIINMSNKKALTKNEADSIIQTMLDFDNVLGLDMNLHLSTALPKDALALIEKREEFRKNRNFSDADNIRRELLEKYKITIEDSKEGTIWYRSTD